MDYALLFTVMGLIIAFLLYAILRLGKRMYLQDKLLRALVSGEVAFTRTEDGIELTMKKGA